MSDPAHEPPNPTADHPLPDRPPALPSPARPLDHTPVHTADLPPTPIRDRAIPATAWVEAPEDLLRVGDDLPGAPVARYVRRIGPWILWRAGPPTKGDARYWAVHVEDLAGARSDDDTTDDHTADGDTADDDTAEGPGPRTHTFTLGPDGTGAGLGPSGAAHQRFRTWKEDLRDNP